MAAKSHPLADLLIRLPLGPHNLVAEVGDKLVVHRIEPALIVEFWTGTSFTQWGRSAGALH